MNWPNKLEWYITLGCNGLPWTNTLAYRAFVSYEENEVLRIRQLAHILARKYQTKLEVNDSDKHSTFLRLIINNGREKFYRTGPGR